MVMTGRWFIKFMIYTIYDCFTHMILKPTFQAKSLLTSPSTTTACTFSTSQLPKVVRRWGVFVHFDFEMCFAPQRRALFRHLNFQKWSENGVFYAFWLRNVLRASTACNLSSLIWPAGSAPAALASLLFDPPEPQIIGKKRSESRLSYLFSHLHLLSTYSFSSTLLSSNLSLLSASSLLCFSSVHIVGSLTSKLPSTMENHRLGEKSSINGPCSIAMSVYWRVYWNTPIMYQSDWCWEANPTNL